VRTVPSYSNAQLLADMVSLAGGKKPMTENTASTTESLDDFLCSHEPGVNCCGECDCDTNTPERLAEWEEAHA
jgi:hypothetical protein